MSSFEINRAVRVNTPAFIALAGPSGSGKTRSGLELAMGLAGDGKVLLADTEGNRALHYADLYEFDHVEFGPPYTPERCAELIDLAEKRGYAVLIVDSGSDEFEGEGGLQEIRDTTKDEFWAKTKMRHKHALVNRIRRARVHVIFCLRCEERVRISKIDGRTVVEPLGWQPICEKRFMHEMQSSFRFDPEHPGKPVPIKLYDIHAKFFPKDKMITREAGRRLAEWAAGGAVAEPKDETADQETSEVRDIPAEAQVAAKAGRKAFVSFYDALTDEQYRLIEDQVDDLKAMARAADRPRPEPEEDALGPRPIADEPASPAGAEAAGAETIPHRSPPTASAAPSLAQKQESPTKWELTASALLEDFRVATDRKRFRVTRGPEIRAVHDSAPRVWGKLLDEMTKIERDSEEA